VSKLSYYYVDKYEDETRYGDLQSGLEPTRVHHFAYLASFSNAKSA